MVKPRLELTVTNRNVMPIVAGLSSAARPSSDAADDRKIRAGIGAREEGE